MPLSNSSELQENVYSDAVNASPLRVLPQVDLCKRGEIRAERFLDAATEVFIEKGYQHARLSEIVARAGGSLATLYRIFGDKEGLAHAILQRRMDSHIGALRGISLSGLPPEQALPEMAMRMAAIMSQPESQVVYRIVIGEGHSFPALRDWFFDHAVAASRSTLADYFQQEVDAGRLQLASPRMAAAQFYMSLFGDLVVRLASGASGLPSPEQLKADVQASVELFLRGALPR